MQKFRRGSSYARQVESHGGIVPPAVRRMVNRQARRSRAFGFASDSGGARSYCFSGKSTNLESLGLV